MRYFAAAALTITACIVLYFFASQGHWLQGLIYSSFPGTAGIAFLPHREQRADPPPRPQVRASSPRENQT